MPRTHGPYQDFPERPLMFLISAALGIPHFSTSRGSSVRRDFLDAVVRQVDPGWNPITQASASKDTLMRHILACLGTPWSAAYTSAGGTITNAGLRAILNSIGVFRRHPIAIRTDILEQHLQVELDAAGVPHLVAAPGSALPSSVLADVLGRLGQVLTSDQHGRAVRTNQAQFRADLLRADASCVITGCAVADVIEAAHVIPWHECHREPWCDTISNGMLLRADVHMLFDRGLIGADPTTKTWSCVPGIADRVYRQLHGTPVRLQRSPEELHDIWSRLQSHWRVTYASLT